MTKRPMQTGTLAAPIWLGFLSRGGWDGPACAALAAENITGWFPTKIITTRRRGKTYTRVRPKIGGYIFGMFTGQPQYDRLAEEVGRVITMGGRPYVISDRVMMQMTQMPDLLAARAEAQREAARIKVGDRVEFLDNPVMGGVDVLSVLDGMIGYWSPLFGGVEAKIETARLRKAAS